MNRGANALENDGLPCAELAYAGTRLPSSDRGRVRRLGRLRLPIAGPYRPWATAYQFPDGRVLWCIRLWDADRPRTHCVPTSTLRTFCRINRLPSVAVELAEIEGR